MKKTIVAIGIVGLFVALFPFLCSIFPLNQLWIKRLENKFGGKVEVGSARFTWLGPQLIKQISYREPSLEANAEEILSPLPFWKIGSFSEYFELKNANAQTSNGLSVEKVFAKINPAQKNAYGISSEGGDFQISQTGSFINANFQKTPTLILDRLLKSDGFLTAILGNLFDLKGSFDLNSKIYQFQLNSTNAVFGAKGVLEKNEILLLSPFSSKLNVTPSLTTFLKFPPAKGTLSLTINPAGFSMPLQFNIEKLVIADGQMKASRFEIANTSLFENLGSILKNSSQLNKQSFVVQSTPIDFSIKNGIFEAQRLDFLLNRSIHFCIWGKINLINQRLFLNLGIPAKTLASLVNVPGLQSNAVLKIPIKGTISNPELESKGVAAKIAALTASQVIPQKGFWGLVPKVLDVALDDQKDIPPQRYPLNQTD